MFEFEIQGMRMCIKGGWRDMVGSVLGRRNRIFESPERGEGIEPGRFKE